MTQLFRQSQLFKCHELEVLHYLSCGGFSTPFEVRGLREFSTYKVNPYTKFPTNCQKHDNTTTVFLVLKGEGKFDGKLLSQGMVAINPLEISGNEKEQVEFVRMRLDTSSQIKEASAEDPNMLLGSKEWSLSRHNTQESQKIPLDPSMRTFVFVLKGEISVEGRKRSLTSGDAILITNGCLTTSVKPSDLIIVQLLV